MTISYNLNIPDGPNNPSNDQPKMKTNTNSINSWTAIDHVEFGAAPAGTHKQTTFSSKNVPGAQTDPQSVLYTNSGTASTVADIHFRNQNGIFPVSIIRAAATFTTVDNTGPFPKAVTIDNGFNVVSIQKLASGGTYTITLTTGVTTGNNVIVVTGETSSNAEPVYSFTNPILTISLNSNSGKISFVVLQV